MPKGEDVIIKRAGKPVARLSTYADRVVERQPGALAGKIFIAPDSDVLPPEREQAFGMADGKYQIPVA
jgi:antitoxin (DNA-binding transcriptional repressor) of toxin-antitoxin stability system